MIVLNKRSLGKRGDAFAAACIVTLSVRVISSRARDDRVSLDPSDVIYFFGFLASNLDIRSHISSDIRGDGYPSFAISRVVVA